MSDIYLSATEVADVVGVHRSTLNRAIRRQVIVPAAKVRGRYLFRPDQITEVAARLLDAKLREAL